MKKAIIIVLIVLALAGIGFYFYNKKKSTTTSPTTESEPQVSTGKPLVSTPVAEQVVAALTPQPAGTSKTYWNAELQANTRVYPATGSLVPVTIEWLGKSVPVTVDKSKDSGSFTSVYFAVSWVREGTKYKFTVKQPTKTPVVLGSYEL